MSQNFNRRSDPAFDESVEELYEFAPCGYLTATADGHIVRVNKTFAEWLGYEREALIDGRRFVDLLTVGGRIFYETHFNLLLRMQKAVDEIALDIVCKDGRILPVLLNARQQRNAEGEPIINRFTIFNATDRRMYERQLLEARDLLKTTLSSIGDGVIATDSDGRVTFMNPVAEELSGWENDAASGRPIDEILDLRNEVAPGKAENPVRRALRDGVVVGLANHTVLFSRNGAAIAIDDSAAPIRNAAGDVIGGVMVFRDISMHRKAEKALEEAHHNLQRQAVELERSNNELSRFAHVASHDLLSPLNTITNYTQLLERRHGKELGDGKALLDRVVSAADRMRNLIDALLKYATVTSEITLSPKPVDANLQLQGALDNLQSIIQESGARVTYAELPQVRMDETSLGQILQNLIGNAIRYRSTVAPKIHIAAMDQGKDWLFSCQDNGLGIPAEYQTTVFDAFKRLHGSERPGSGLGLSVCKKIIERYGGRIWVESQNNAGSTFFFTVPKRQEETQAGIFSTEQS